MNCFLPVLMLAALFAAPGWADEESEAQPDADVTTQLPLSVEIDSNSDAGSDDAYRERLKRQIRAAVQDFIADEIASDPDLSDEEREAIEDELEERFLSADLDIDGPTSAGEVTIAILAIMLIFGTPIMIVGAVLYSNYRKRRLVRDTVSDYLASGQQVPPEVWRGLSGDTAPKNNLNRGMITLALGIGVFLCFALMGAMEAAYLGLIPLFIGIAQLLIWKLEKGKAGPGE